MEFRSAIHYGLVLSLISSPSLATENKTTLTNNAVQAENAALVANQPVKMAKELIIEANNNVIVPETDLDIIKKFAKSFHFDWSNYAGILDNKKAVSEVEPHFKKVNDFSKLTTEEKPEVGLFLYRLGTFYTHIARQPDLAINALNEADPLLPNKEEKIWNYNHLAYAYEQKYALTGNDADKLKAYEYLNKVIYPMNPDQKNKAVAFAYSIQGLVQMDAKDFAQAETSFKHSLQIQESLPSKDVLYAHTKYRLAENLLNQKGRDQEALALLEQAKQFWQNKSDITQDPFAARNFVLLGQAHMKVGQNQAAREDLTRAISIYQTVYGQNSSQLIEPYQNLAELYEKMGDSKQAELYGKKAAILSKERI